MQLHDAGEVPFRRQALKVYLAGRYGRKEELRHAATYLRARGFEVTARWLDETFAPSVRLGEFTEAELRDIALYDLKDISDADALIFFSEPPDTGIPRGGRHVEFGYALATGKTLVIVGPRENVFHYLAGLPTFPSIGAAADHLHSHP